jgi:hypothetical protein
MQRLSSVFPFTKQFLETVWKFQIGLDVGCSEWPKQGEEVQFWPLEPLNTGDPRPLQLFSRQSLVGEFCELRLFQNSRKLAVTSSPAGKGTGLISWLSGGPLPIGAVGTHGYLSFLIK